MAFTQEDFQAHLASADTSIAAGDYASARVYAVRAQTVLAGLADYADGDRSVKNKELVDSLLKNLDILESKGSDARKNSRVLVSYSRQ